MGVGKSTVGRILAELLGRPFVDLDHAVEAAAGRGIAELFATEGEAGFRAREHVALEGVLARREPQVVALGGGTLHQPGNLELLREAGAAVVVLVLEEAALWARLRQLEERGGDPGRPLLAQARSLYRERAPGYLDAGAQLQVTGLAPREAATAAVRLLGLEGEVRP